MSAQTSLSISSKIDTAWEILPGVCQNKPDRFAALRR